jgi:hypothetical protein
MSAKIEHPIQFRECPECHESKPLTRGFFESYKGEGSRPSEWKPNCRVCINKVRRAKAVTRRCTGCETSYPSTPEHFPPRGIDVTHPEGGLRSRCWSCHRASRNGCGANPRRMRPLAAEREYIRGPKPCDDCGSMPWRVAGPRCPCCKLEYADEPAPELQLRRFDNERVV